MAVGHVRESAWAAWRRPLIYVLGVLCLLDLVAMMVTGFGAIGVFGVAHEEIDCGSLFVPASDPNCVGSHAQELPIVFDTALLLVVLVVALAFVVPLKPRRAV